MLNSLTTHPLVIVPGIGDSGPTHWQSLWQDAHPDARRIAPASFDEPDLNDWLDAIDRAVADCPAPPVIAAHSLGTLAMLAWTRTRDPRTVRAMILVAIPDPDGPDFPVDAPSFVEVTAGPLEIPTVVVASTDDPYDQHEYGAQVAAISDARLELIGPVGHINAASALGDWPVGQQFLADLL